MSDILAAKFLKTEKNLVRQLQTLLGAESKYAGVKVTDEVIQEIESSIRKVIKTTLSSTHDIDKIKVKLGKISDDELDVDVYCNDEDVDKDVSEVIKDARLDVTQLMKPAKELDDIWAQFKDC